MLAERFCKLKKEWEEGYNDLFAQYYATVHRLETNKLRNVAKIFGHLMHTGTHSQKSSLRCTAGAFNVVQLMYWGADFFRNVRPPCRCHVMDLLGIYSGLCVLTCRV